MFFNKNKKLNIFFFVSVLLGVYIFSYSNVFAYTIRFLDLKNYKVKKYFYLANDDFVHNFAIGDLRNDGNYEIVLAPIYNKEGKVSIYDSDSSLLSSFYPYGEYNKSGISLLIDDFNGDGRAELLTAPGRGSLGEIKFFDLNGNEIFKTIKIFNNYNGISVCTLDIDGDGIKEIAVANIFGGIGTIKIIDYKGTIKSQFKVDALNSMFSLNMTAIDLSDDGYDELAIAGQYGAQTYVSFYLANGKKLDKQLLYHPKNKTGLSLSSADVDGEKGEELIVAPLFPGGPYIKVFDQYLKMKAGFFIDNYKKDYGTLLSTYDIDKDGVKELVVAKSNVKEKNVFQEKGHYIDINVRTQRFSYYDNAYLIANVITSTGKPSTPTRIGTFHVQTKVKMAYGGIKGQRWAMPFWVGFYFAGAVQNGIHALPYVNGIKERTSDLGKAVSHGCVRLSDWEIERFYNWVNIGDLIRVHK